MVTDVLLWLVDEVKISELNYPIVAVIMRVKDHPLSAV